jgi:hypothetical protein
MDLAKSVFAVHGGAESGKPSIAAMGVALVPSALMDSGVAGVRVLTLPDTGVLSEVQLWNECQMPAVLPSLVALFLDGVGRR